jgi:hypothetical protein
MRLKTVSTTTWVCLLAVMASLMLLAGCNNGSSSSPPPPPAADNTVTATVEEGPGGSAFVNFLFVTVTVCMPGSTTNCVEVPNVQVDTGSEGLRVLGSALGNLAPTTSGSGLPTIKDTGNNVLQECVQFADATYAWGPVAVANIQIAGETASAVPGSSANSGVPIQVLTTSNPYAVPGSCLTLGNPGPSGNLNTVVALGANGLLGVGVFPQDCGPACAGAQTFTGYPYYLCPSGVCDTVPNVLGGGVPVADQLWNPIAAFSSADSNGVLITLPSIDPGGALSASGSLTFGVATQTDNALGSAQVYATDAYGDIQTTYPTTNGVAYPGFFDTASTGYFFLDATTLGSTGITECLDNQSNPTGWYCPSSPVSLTVTNNTGDGTEVPLTFSIANADTLFSAASNFAFDNLGGDSGTGGSTDFADFGMPFFFGKKVFIGIAGATPPSGVSVTYGYYAF